MVVARKREEVATEASTLEWRQRVRDELKRRGRGAQAELVKALGIRSSVLSETINESADKPATRYTRYRRAIDEYLWPPLLPPAADTNELRFLLDGITEIDRDLLRIIKDMDRDEQRKLAEAIIAMRGRSR